MYILFLYFFRLVSFFFEVFSLCLASPGVWGTLRGAYRNAGPSSLHVAIAPLRCHFVATSNTSNFSVHSSTSQLLNSTQLWSLPTLPFTKFMLAPRQYSSPTVDESLKDLAESGVDNVGETSQDCSCLLLSPNFQKLEMLWNVMKCCDRSKHGLRIFVSKLFFSGWVPLVEVWSLRV